jgi:hypothetical protein
VSWDERLIHGADFNSIVLNITMENCGFILNDLCPSVIINVGTFVKIIG